MCFISVLYCFLLIKGYIIYFVNQSSNLYFGGVFLHAQQACPRLSRTRYCFCSQKTFKLVSNNFCVSLLYINNQHIWNLRETVERSRVATNGFGGSYFVTTCSLILDVVSAYFVIFSLFSLDSLIDIAIGNPRKKNQLLHTGSGKICQSFI